ncbi:MAG: histidine phosphatase family protein [Myxococcota bacterium]|nr:histidine phosphatase family protein [Myxococcota bacterium]
MTLPASSDWTTLPPVRPKRIILVRHGESEGNVDRTRYESIPDYAVSLTDTGRAQATRAAEEIRGIIGDETIHAYVSPFHRTRQTFEEIAKVLVDNLAESVEDPRIREQEWGHLRGQVENDEIVRERDDYSTFYYRIPDGESGADVFDRVSTFLETLHRDFRKSDYPKNCLIITHGLTLRLFLMRWFHWSVEEFESLRNPENAQVVVMVEEANQRYRLLSTLPKR